MILSRLHPGRKRKEGRSGLAMTEFAFVAPVYVMIILGVIEMARALEVALLITAAAREGGRLGILHGVGEGDQADRANIKVTKDIKAFLAASRIDASKVDVQIIEAEPDDPENPAEVTLTEANKNTYFKVKVSVPFEDVAYGPVVFLQGQTLSGEINVRHE